MAETGKKRKREEEEEDVDSSDAEYADVVDDGSAKHETAMLESRKESVVFLVDC